MSDPENILDDSPADFDSSLAYALHGEMRRLVILTIVGSLILPVGLAMFLNPVYFTGIAEEIVRRIIGLIIAVIGATFLYGGLVGALFKIIADANILANHQQRE